MSVRDELRAVREALVMQQQAFSLLQEEVKLLRQDGFSGGSSSSSSRGGVGSLARAARAEATPARCDLLQHAEIVQERGHLSQRRTQAQLSDVGPCQSARAVPSFQMLRPHEELRDAGALVEWQPGMNPVLFCSHTWLRHRHPDSSQGDKFKTSRACCVASWPASLTSRPAG